MKRLVKRGLRAFWRWTSPLRRPLLSKIDGYFDRRLQPDERLLAAERQRAEETNAVLNFVVRELIRLQRQVETLQQSIDDLADSSPGPAIAVETDRDDLSRKAG
jgi:hypothetical protein